MTTTIINAQNNTQDLFTITFPFPRVPLYGSGGQSAVLTFDTTNVSQTAAASLNGATGQITLSSTGTVYQISAQAEITNPVPVHLKLVETATGNQVGVAVPITMPLNVVLQPASAGDYQIVVYTDEEINFEYPSQIRLAQVTVQALNGQSGFNQSLNTTDSVEFANITVTGIITATVMTVEHTTVTTTIVETDDIIRTTNATQAGAGVGAIVATAGGISAGSGFYTANTSTFGFATFGPNNGAVAPVNVVADAETMLYFNNNIGGSLIFRQRQNSTAYRNFTISRNGSLILDSGASVTLGALGAGDVYISSYFNTTTNVSGTAGLNSYQGEGSVQVSSNGVLLQSFGDGKTIQMFANTPSESILAATISTTTFDISVPVVINNIATLSTTSISLGVLNDTNILINGIDDVTFGNGQSAASGGTRLGNAQNQPFRFGNYNNGISHSLGISTSGAYVYGPNAETIATFTTSSAAISVTDLTEIMDFNLDPTGGLTLTDANTGAIIQAQPANTTIYAFDGVYPVIGVSVNSSTVKIGVETGELGGQVYANRGADLAADVEIKGGADVSLATFNTQTVSVSVPFTFPNYDDLTANGITGSVGQVIAINNSLGNAGKLAYWDTTNSRWSYVDDNSAV